MPGTNHKATAKTKILMRLAEYQSPVPVHNLGIYGVSDNSAATRLSELATAGFVIGEYTGSEPFKRWRLAKPGEVARRAKHQHQTFRVVGSRPASEPGFQVLTVRSDAEIPTGTVLRTA